MISISLDTGNLPSVLNALRDPAIAQQVANVMAESYNDDIHDWIDAGRGFTPRSPGGSLEQAINWRPIGNGTAVVSILDQPRIKRDPETGREQLVNPHQYGMYVEKGTRPHQIGPKPDRKGVKMNVPGIGYIVRREFMHPGSRPHPYFFADQTARTSTMQAKALSVLASRIADG